MVRQDVKFHSLDYAKTPKNIATPMINRTVERRINANRRRTVSVIDVGASKAFEGDDAGIRILIWPLAIVLVSLIVLAGTLLWHQQEQRLNDQIDYRIWGVADAFYSTHDQQVDIMSALLDTITADPALREALLAQDRKRLLALSIKTAERLRQNHGIGLFHFYDQNRHTLLQVHAPERSGDRIDSWIAHEAERTGVKAGGLEIGYFGIPVLRVVKPIQSDGKIIGFVELAKKTEKLLKWLHRESNVEIAFSIHKNLVNREIWESGMQMEGKEPDWDLFPSDVIAYRSVWPLPEGLLEPHLGKYGQHEYGRHFEVRTGGRLWRTGYTPIIEASGRDIGDLTVMLDVTDLQEEFRRTMAGAGILTMVLLIFLIFFLYTLLKKTDQRILTQQRERYRARLMQDLAAHREKIREGERTSIAREIHDQLGQCLTGLRLEAGLFKRLLGPKQTELMLHATSMIDIIDTTLSTVRDITTALRPAVLDMGLVPAAEWLLADTAKRAGLEYHFEADDIEECRLSEEQATALFRTLQEALTNIIRHARAAQVRVSIKRMDGGLAMRIEDDGVGFETGTDEHRSGKSFGLIGMRERAIMIGGDLNIDSGPGEGTVVLVNIPCNRRRED